MNQSFLEPLDDERQASFKNIAFDLMSAFLNTHDIDRAVNECIGRIGRICNAGRAYVFRFRDGGGSMDNTHEWCAPDVESEKEHLQGLKTDIFPWWMDRLSTGHHINITSVADLPPEASAERAILEPQGIRSLLALPFSLNDELGGYIGFDNVHNTCGWGERDFYLLQISANIIGNAFEREWRHQELIKAKEIAERAARAKAEFADYVAHEIRTPLTSIIATIEALEEIECNDEQREYLSLISEGASTLSSIINQTLDFSRAQAGRVTLEHLPFNLSDVVKKRVEMCRPAAIRKGLALEMDLAPSASGMVKGDRQRLGQVLGNLLGNAIKFTHKGAVRVEAYGKQHNDKQITVYFKIVDTGSGIAPEAIPYLFERFSQESASTARKFGGSGLGLAICKHLVEHMGGTIDVSSEPGTGSIFSFSVVFEDPHREVF